VKTCPASARHFGDFADPTSDVSKMVADRGGINLMPEMETSPVNKYLPPRPKTRPDAPKTTEMPAAVVADKGVLGWLDRALTSLDKLG
jgi:hypothetical protein